MIHVHFGTLIIVISIYQPAVHMSFYYLEVVILRYFVRFAAKLNYDLCVRNVYIEV